MTRGNYGRTDPSEYQLRDMKRRLTKVEKGMDRLISRHERFVAKIRALTAGLGKAVSQSEEE